MNGIADLVRSAKGDAEKESVELNIEEFKKALSLVDSQVKFLPATAQVFIFFLLQSINWFNSFQVANLISVRSLCPKFLTSFFFFLARWLRSKGNILLGVLTRWRMLKNILKALSASGEKAAIASVLSGSYSITRLLDVFTVGQIHFIVFVLMQLLCTMLCQLPQHSSKSVHLFFSESDSITSLILQVPASGPIRSTRRWANCRTAPRRLDLHWPQHSVALVLRVCDVSVSLSMTAK